MGKILDYFAGFKNWFLKKSLLTKIFMMFLAIGMLMFVLSKIRAGNSNQPQLQTVNVTRGTVVESVGASGNVMASGIVNITTSASGVVNKIYVKDGEKVSAGAKIAQINLDADGKTKAASAWASYLSAKNAVETQNINLLTLQSDMYSKWENFLTLSANPIYLNPAVAALPEFQIAQNDWKAAESKYKNQSAVLAQSKASQTSSWYSYLASSSTVTAPQAGVVKNLSVVEGMILSLGSGQSTTVSSTKIGVIENAGKTLISVNLTEIDVPKIKIGQKATITLDSISDKTFTGKVVTIDKIGTSSSGVTNYPVVIELDTTSEEILPNMAVTANIVINSKSNVLFVPSASISTLNGQSAVTVLRGGQQLQVNVTTGLASDTETEITSGLSEGDVVVTGQVSTVPAPSGTSPFSGGFGGGFRTGGGGTRGR